jgi:3-methyladenine DNA glycosylase Mpg
VSQGIAPSLVDASVTPDTAIEASRRIGITKGVDLLWRFTLRNDPYLSRR